MNSSILPKTHNLYLTTRVLILISLQKQHEISSIHNTNSKKTPQGTKNLFCCYCCLLGFFGKNLEIHQPQNIENICKWAERKTTGQTDGDWETERLWERKTDILRDPQTDWQNWESNLPKVENNNIQSISFVPIFYTKTIIKIVNLLSGTMSYFSLQVNVQCMRKFGISFWKKLPLTPRTMIPICVSHISKIVK